MKFKSSMIKFGVKVNRNNTTQLWDSAYMRGVRRDVVGNCSRTDPQRLKKELGHMVQYDDQYYDKLYV